MLLKLGSEDAKRLVTIRYCLPINFISLTVGGPVPRMTCTSSLLKGSKARQGKAPASAIDAEDVKKTAFCWKQRYFMTELLRD